MISCEEALELVLADLPERKSDLVPIRDALGYVLSGSLVADTDVPPFDRAAMDGYAVRSVDAAQVPADLELAGEVRAGGESAAALGPGQAFAIMTGAPVPGGADAVQMFEQTQPSADGLKVRILRAVKPGENIALRGSEAQRGGEVIEEGRCIGPAEMAVLATFGFSRVSVYTRPRVALIVTGDELVEIEDTPSPSQIRNSNAYSIASQLRLMQIEPEYLGIVRDEPQALRERISEALERDVVILTGGVSMGRHDYVKEVFGELGVDIVFSKVAMKPGKPTVFARKGNKLLFGLPGNPVSTFISFENFVRPALGRICGLSKPELQRVRGELRLDMRQTPGRTSFLPARVGLCGSGCIIEPLPWKGSADIIGFARANAAVVFPSERNFMAKGEIVEALLLPDYFTRQR